MLQNSVIWHYHSFFRETCHEAWSNLRLSPMFGCICPNNHMKRRCDRIFTMVNHNPCVGKLNVAIFWPERDASHSHFHLSCRTLTWFTVIALLHRHYWRKGTNIETTTTTTTCLLSTVYTNALSLVITHC